jgi:hypothetical protein
MTFTVAPMPMFEPVNFTLSTSTKLALVISNPVPPVCLISAVPFVT